MGLALEISLDKDIKQISGFFTDLKFKAITKAAKQALNRTANSTRSDAIKEIRKRRKAKLSDLKGGKNKLGFVTVNKAQGNNLASLEASVNFSGIPLPLILFILGTKTPKRQTLANPRRKSRRFEIIKGKKQAKAGLFVEKAKSGGRQFRVFRRANPNDSSEGFRVQSAPSIAEIFRRKTNLLNKIENRAIAKLQRTFDSALVNQLKDLKL